MKNRCYNKNNPEYHNYGARGIAVCDKWKTDFVSFLADVGFRPDPKLTIERKDNNIGYEPANVVWATRADQMRNQRRNKLTIEDARTIRSLKEQGFRTRDIVKRFRVSGTVIKGIIANKIWKE
jgi:hypothetical protein